MHAGLRTASLAVAVLCLAISLGCGDDSSSDPGGDTAGSGGAPGGGTGGRLTSGSGGDVYGTCEVGLPCQEPSDCCTLVPEGATCNQDYPYLFDCVGGGCRRRGCSTEADCALLFSGYADSTEYTGVGCQDGECVVAERCEQTDDCCTSSIETGGYTCGQDYPYLFDCVNGACQTFSCTTDAQCDTFGDNSAERGVVNAGCISGACVIGEPCQQASDCCPSDAEASDYTCGQDYPYLFDCIDGACQTLGCTTDAQCDIYLTTAVGNGIVSLGCQ